MNLRHMYAAAALQALVGASLQQTNVERGVSGKILDRASELGRRPKQHLAIAAFEYADEMMKADPGSSLVGALRGAESVLERSLRHGFLKAEAESLLRDIRRILSAEGEA